jgi:hypothetical protein
VYTKELLLLKIDKNEYGKSWKHENVHSGVVELSRLSLWTVSSGMKQKNKKRGREYEENYAADVSH